MTDRVLRIGGASGFWGDAARATPQLLADGNLDYLVYDYLAEITMSIMARSRSHDQEKGYAVDFLSMAMRPNLEQIAKQGIKVVSNAGGVNPKACAEALCAIITELKLDLTVAYVTGDDLIAQAEALSEAGVTEMFSSESFPEPEKVLSINAYLGAFPIAAALDRGADIVITGRCVDSAVTLGACIHEFGWSRGDFDQLAMGSLAGHILECGPQATGGNFTDWESISGFEDLGYPIAEITHTGEFICTKPKQSSGVVSVGTVSEQMLYEIGDPQAYVLPDVVCDFSTAVIEQDAPNRVRVSGARGRKAPDTYKVSATYADQYRGGTYMTYCGENAIKKANILGEAIFSSARKTFANFGLADFSQTSLELIGAESQYGNFARACDCKEVVMKIAAKHPDAMGIGIMLKESVGLALAAPPGLSSFAGARPKPSPVVRLFSFLITKNQLDVKVSINGSDTSCDESFGQTFDVTTVARPDLPQINLNGDVTQVPLSALAWARSGDKGNKANIGVIARDKKYLPYIYRELSESVVRDRFTHFFADTSEGCVEKFLLPGANAINFLLHDVLGGGGIASIRNDAQGKSYAQILLSCRINVPLAMAETLS